MHANKPGPPPQASVRVALLARPGAARDTLRNVLHAAGAEVELVLEGDPLQLDPAALRATAPQAVLVALDVVVEARLSPFDDVLLDDAVLAIYEEADVVARRDDWENARWLRHVMAKLHRHGDVLPPRPATARKDLAVETVEACIGSWMVPVPAEPATPAASAPVPGAVLVLAGMGGPDALRQLLAALPVDFHRPVLIHQRLYGGHYDHLLRQLARASVLPVRLAREGEAALPGHAYLLPEGIVATADAGALRFVTGDDDFAGLPAAGSAVLLLSGCETGLAEAATSWAQGGACLVAQSPETCFDDAAARALLAQGGDTAAPAALAQRLCAQA